jgi:ABC-type oligopeptide transport system ATPase subunit
LEVVCVSAELLRVHELTKRFARPGRRTDPLLAVDGVSFSIDRGTIFGLVGESGSGKTTTGFCVLQLLRPDAGSVTLDGVELTRLGGRRLRRQRRAMQVVFQDPYSSLDPRMTLGGVVREPLDIHAVGTPGARRRQVAELLESVGLDPSLADRRPHELSGGQRQRVGIARALALDPDFIVCDEPVSSLDVSVQAQILNLLKGLQEERGITYLFISHDLAVIRAICDRVAVMKAGRIVEQGGADRVYDDPQHPYTRELLAAVPGGDAR